MKRIKKLAILLIVALISVFIILPKTNAASEAPNSFTMSRTDNYKLTGSNYIEGINLNFYRQKTTDGKYVYCIERLDSFTKSTETYTKNGTLDVGLAYILEHAYPNVSFTGNSDEDYWITQTAVWYYLEQNSTLWRNFDFSKGTYRGTYNKDVEIINDLIVGAKKATGKTYSLNLNKSSDFFTLNSTKTYYVSSRLVANGSGIDNYSVTPTSAPSGTYVADTNGKVKSTFKTGEAFYVYVPADSVTKDTSVNLKISANSTYGVAYRYDPSNSSNQSVAALYNDAVQLSETIKINLTYIKKIITTVDIYKIDAVSNTDIAGATMVLKNASGNVIERWVSDGKVHRITGLDFGTYTIHEESAPKGYEINKNPVSFTLSESNYSRTINFINYKKETPVINILKVDSSNNKPLAGASLVIKDEVGKIVCSWVSTENYHTITGLDINKKYYLSETSAPNGYEVNSQVIEFTVEAGEKVITFSNAPKLPDNPPTGVEDFILPGTMTILFSGVGYIFLKKNNPIKQF